MTDERKRLSDEAKERLAECKAQRSFIRSELEECYFFIAPRRHRQATAHGAMKTSPPTDAPELQISIGMEVADDFAGEVIQTFMPSTHNWADLKPGAVLNKDDWEDIQEDVKQVGEAVFQAIKSSDFYAAMAQTAKPDLAIGTMALWIDDVAASKPIDCRPIPATELEINIGPDGRVGDRFVCRKTKRRFLKAILPGVTLPSGYDNPNDGKKDCEVRWGFWPIYGRSEEAWQAVVMVDDKVVDDRVLTGEGSCPLLIGRWDPDPGFPWGNGPALKCLPELRALDEIEALKIESADFQIHPAIYYPDDGVMNFEAGIEPGMGYPKRPGGGANDIGSLTFTGNVDFAQFTVMEKEQRVRRLHFVDFPMQRGDTPPTATQWADEMALRQRRFGMPGLTFWREIPAEVVKRFMHILVKRGRIQPISANGQTIALVPYNAAEAAKDLQEVTTATRLLETGMGMFPQVGQVAIDAIKTLKNMQTKMRDTIVVIREPDDLKQTVETLAPVLGMGGGADPGVPPA